MIKNLSPSRASQFKTCPKQFEYANVIKIEQPTNEVQAKGTTIHTALEILYDKRPEERTVANLHTIFRAAWNDVRNNDEHSNLFETREDEREWGLDALNLLSNYFKLEDPKAIQPLERERWVKGEIEDLKLRGILDRMDEDSNGNLIILDYKSGKAPAIKYKEPRFFALKLYALLIQEETGKTPSELKLIYLKNSTVHTLEVNQDMLKEVKEEVLEIWKQIKVSFENDNFPAIKNTLCDWCYFKPICPVFNDDHPNTDDLKKLTLEINEFEETLSAISMFDNTSDLPPSSNIHGVNKEEIESKIKSLQNERESIIAKINKLLRE